MVSSVIQSAVCHHLNTLLQWNNVIKNFFITIPVQSYQSRCWCGQIWLVTMRAVCTKRGGLWSVWSSCLDIQFLVCVYNMADLHEALISVDHSSAHASVKCLKTPHVSAYLTRSFRGRVNYDSCHYGAKVEVAWCYYWGFNQPGEEVMVRWSAKHAILHQWRGPVCICSQCSGCVTILEIHIHSSLLVTEQKKTVGVWGLVARVVPSP